MATTTKKTATKATKASAKAGEKKLLKRVEASLKFQGSYSPDIAKIVTNL